MTTSSSALYTGRSAFSLDYRMLIGIAPGMKTATFLVSRGTHLDHLRWQAPPSLPSIVMEPEARQVYCMAVKSVGQYSPGSTWSQFDDGAGASYVVQAGTASLANGLISGFDVSSSGGGTGDVSGFLSQYAMGTASMPSPCEDVTLTITSSVDLKNAMQGHVDIEFWWSFGPPLMLPGSTSPISVGP